MTWVNKNCYVVSVIVILCVALFFLIHRLDVVKADAERYRNNNKVLLADIDTLRTREGSLYARVKDLELKKREFEKLLSDDAKTIASVKRRNEELDRLVKAGIDSKVEVETVVRDSIVYVDRNIEKLQVIDWSDGRWESVHAEVRRDSLVKLRLAHHDEVDVMVFLEYRRFLWIKTKLKGCNVDLVSRNPYTTGLDVSSVKIVK